LRNHRQQSHERATSPTSGARTCRFSRNRRPRGGCAPIFNCYVRTGSRLIFRIFSGKPLGWGVVAGRRVSRPERSPVTSRRSRRPRGRRPSHLGVFLTPYWQVVTSACCRRGSRGGAGDTSPIVKFLFKSGKVKVKCYF
jgi:hypothetical protein